MVPEGAGPRQLHPLATRPIYVSPEFLRRYETAVVEQVKGCPGWGCSMTKSGGWVVRYSGSWSKGLMMIDGLVGDWALI